MTSCTNVTLFYVNPFKTGRIKYLSYTAETRSITLYFYVRKTVNTKSPGSEDMETGPGGRAT